MKRKFGYDDSLDVFGVHGIGGIIGALLTGVFVSSSLGGAGFEEGVTMMSQVWSQIVSVVVTLIWSGLLSYIILKVIDKTLGLRVDEEAEIQGLDLSSHDEKGYNL